MARDKCDCMKDEDNKSMTVAEYIKKYGVIQVEGGQGFLFYSNGHDQIGGRITKQNGVVRCL